MFFCIKFFLNTVAYIKIICTFEVNKFFFIKFFCDLVGPEQSGPFFIYSLDITLTGLRISIFDIYLRSDDFLLIY
ncbi:hypothetical protein C7E23_09320 [Elizabethkingia anophelis]|nr:hypothetical protein C7E23_09320 [Elizabethkingia anophelis]